MAFFWKEGWIRVAKRKNEVIRDRARSYIRAKTKIDFYKRALTEIFFDFAKKEIYDIKTKSIKVSEIQRKIRNRKKREETFKEIKESFYEYSTNLVGNIMFIDPGFFDRLENKELNDEDKANIQREFKKAARAILGVTIK